ncbi:MAG: O-succinylhomoserine sulfhydrylase [Hydrogenophilales bacterium 12-64-6]|nr:MAG: O-succinylhomoserine sulfhydrylase [Hydrogenophilales bacterium 12-64-6]
MDNDEYDIETLAVRAGTVRSQFNEHSEAIFLTSSFMFGSAAEAAARFKGEQPGPIYARFANPTVNMMEARLAALEGAERCVAFSSGMASILATVYVSPTDPAEWRAAVKPNTKLFFVESPSNPLTEVSDIRALADIAHEAGAWLAVDNCFCSPALQKPLELGADIVIHSATKYLDGQGRVLGGAVLGSKELMEGVFTFLRTAGPTLSAFNAWVILKGMETLSLRMEAHSRNALALAQWLEAQPQVARVWYPGLPSHPQHELAMRQQKTGGGIVSFELKGGKDAAWKLIDATKLLSITANLGDTKSTITHPASTTHSRMTPEQRAAAGISDGLVRIAAGLESVADIQADLARGLAG